MNEKMQTAFGIEIGDKSILSCIPKFILDFVNQTFSD